MSKKRSVFLLLSAIVAILVLIYLYGYIADTMGAARGSASSIGVALGATITAPFRVAVGIGAAFAAVGWLFALAWAGLVAGIVFCVSMALLPAWLLFSVLPAALAFIGYARMRK